MSAKHGLEHHLWGFLKSQKLLNKKLILACSGGADSVALVRAMAAVRPAENLVVAHIHHGPGNDEFRDEAEEFVRDLGGRLHLPYEAGRHSGKPLRSEKELRDVRRALLEEIRLAHQGDFVVMAHHRRDLAETRVLRLLRGTGPQGFAAILPVRGVWVRPFLETSPQVLREYLQVLDQVFLEDPTNQESGSLRNWLRNVWFPALEKRHPGAVGAFSRSFEDIAAALQPSKAFKKPQIARRRWESSSQSERLRFIAECLHYAGQKGMSRGLLKEIERRLDNEKKEYTFSLGGCLWAVNVHQIRTIRQG